MLRHDRACLQQEADPLRGVERADVEADVLRRKLELVAQQPLLVGGDILPELGEFAHVDVFCTTVMRSRGKPLSLRPRSAPRFVYAKNQ